MTPLSLVPLPWRLAAAGAALLALGAAYAVWHHKVYRSGYDAAIADVAADNAEAVHATDQARARVRACSGADGMRWDQVARECVAGP